MSSDEEILFRDLISRYQAGERDFSEVTIETGPDSPTWKLGQFNGLDLSGIILRDSNIIWLRNWLDGVIMHGADLTRVDLGECNFAEGDLSNAILCETRFFRSVFEMANFSGPDLTGARLAWTDFFGTDMSRVKLNGTRISALGFVRTDFTDATFSGARLKYVTFEKAKLVRTDFRGADFCLEDESASVKFRECRFEQTIMPDGSIRTGSTGE